MGGVLFILGAGASRQDGAPLMKDFLGAARRLHAADEVPEHAKRSFEKVLKAVGQLQVVHSKANLETFNIESVFSAIDMGKTIGRFPGLKSLDEIDELRRDIILLIAVTLERTLLFRQLDRGRLAPTPTYEAFVTIIKHLRGRAWPRNRVGVITFNYDIALDFALGREGIKVDYGFDQPAGRDALPVLKLHGSLNWSTCHACKSVVPVPLEDLLKDRLFMDQHPGGNTFLPISTYLGSQPHVCGANLAGTPVIVPPTWQKQDYHSAISTVWARAAQELSVADNIFVSGYSLPESDAFFRYLYALGSVGDNPLERFWVFDPDKTGTLEPRFRNLLGRGAESCFAFKKMTFSEGFNEVLKLFPPRGQ